ncbi:sterol desaturase family protein [Aurantivibrio plasticivorans]
MPISELPSPMEILLDPLTFIAAGIYLALIAWEALCPARKLPAVSLWKTKGLLFFVINLLVSTYLPLMWDGYLASYQLFDLTGANFAVQVAVGFLTYELVLYIWHRSLHSSDFLWQHLHQMHHSAERLDSFGAFWLSPIDLIGFSMVGSVALVLGVGISADAATIVIVATFFFAIFQHLNIRTPRWLGYFVQRPESHSHHHGRGVHRNNYADVPWFDMLFGTFVNPKEHQDNGFYQGASTRVWEMLMGRDVTKPPYEQDLLPLKEAI